jgi:transposase-like protein
MGIGRPKGAKNVMRTPEEKERIVLEAIERGVGRTAEAHGVDRRLLQKWIAKYSAGGIDSLRSQTGKCGKGNPLAGLQRKKNKSREEELELEVLKLKIENERLKKGYRVKGGGRGKEFVTTKGSNTRS